MFPEVGIVVLNYNCAEISLRLLENLRAQRDVTLRLVLVDNCSKEGDRKKLQAGLTADVIFLPQDVNRGYAAGNNAGLRRLAAEKVDYMAVANPDIMFDDSHFLISLIDEYRKKDDIGFISGVQIIPGHPECGSSTYRLVPYSELLINCFFLGRLLSAKRHPEKKISTGMERYEVLPGCFFLGSRSVWEKIDFFDEETFLFGEEAIIAKKIQKFNLNNYVCHDLSFMHLHSFSVKKSVSLFRQYMLWRKSKMIFLRKYCGATKFQTMVFAVLSFYMAVEMFLFNSLKSLLGKRKH